MNIINQGYLPHVLFRNVYLPGIKEKPFPEQLSSYNSLFNVTIILIEK